MKSSLTIGPDGLLILALLVALLWSMTTQSETEFNKVLETTEVIVLAAMVRRLPKQQSD